MFYFDFVMISPLIHFILILDPLHTYNRCLVYFICGGQLYDCVLTPLSSQSQKTWPSLVLDIMVKVMVCCELGPQTTDTHISQ